GRDQERQARVVDRVGDEHGPVERGFELHARGQHLLDAWDGLANASRHVDEVRFRLPDYADGDGGICIVAEDRARVLGRELDARHILELDDLPALTRHDQLPEFPWVLQLAQGPDRELPPRRFDASGGNLDVARGDRALHVLHGEAPRRQLVGLYPYPHREAPLAEHPRAADTRQTLQPRFHQAVGHVGQLHQVVVRAAQGQPEEWLGVGLLLRDHRLEHVDRQPPPHPRYLVAHVLRSDVDGPVEVELQDDLAVLLRRGARQGAQSL